MKKLLMSCLIGLISLSGAVWSQAQDTSGTEKAIVALEQQWLQSQKTNNPDLVAPLLADKFIISESDGKVSNKSEMLASSKSSKYENVEYQDLKVTVFSNTAIATGIFKGKVTDASGKTTDEYARFTDTWVKMPNGKWQCVASHSSNVKT
ncbi:MAG TPA: nuclear transport factor 2 family protein [Candidatus Dormibacteraeota bacterium]|nr:nuclear transport factor 2 family protein [Candidatus Dormibacteraeota bacterium]